MFNVSTRIFSAHTVQGRRGIPTTSVGADADRRRLINTKKIQLVWPLQSTPEGLNDDCGLIKRLLIAKRPSSSSSNKSHHHHHHHHAARSWYGQLPALQFVPTLCSGSSGYAVWATLYLIVISSFVQYFSPLKTPKEFTRETSCE